MFDLLIETPSTPHKSAGNKVSKKLPVNVAKNPDIRVLASIWEGRDNSFDELCKKARGHRL